MRTYTDESTAYESAVSALQSFNNNSNYGSSGSSNNSSSNSNTSRNVKDHIQAINSKTGTTTTLLSGNPTLSKYYNDRHSQGSGSSNSTRSGSRNQKPSHQQQHGGSIVQKYTNNSLKGGEYIHDDQPHCPHTFGDEQHDYHCQICLPPPFVGRVSNSSTIESYNTAANNNEETFVQKNVVPVKNMKENNGNKNEKKKLERDYSKENRVRAAVRGADKKKTNHHNNNLLNNVQESDDESSDSDYVAEDDEDEDDDINEYVDRDDDDDDDDEDDSNNDTPRLNTRSPGVIGSGNNNRSTNGTIALFGAFGTTGNHFLKQALNAGYNVRALLLPSVQIQARGGSGSSRNTRTLTAAALQNEYADHSTTLLQWIPTKSLFDTNSIQRVLNNVDYVVCMMNDTIYSQPDTPGSKVKSSPMKTLSKNNNNNNQNNAPTLKKFVETLYPIMKKEKSIKVFLYQATSLAVDVNGSTPILSQVLKSVSNFHILPTSGSGGKKRMNNNNNKNGMNCSKSFFLRDQDEAIQYIASQHRNTVSNNNNNNNNKLKTVDNKTNTTNKSIPSSSLKESIDDNKNKKKNRKGDRQKKNDDDESDDEAKSDVDDDESSEENDENNKKKSTTKNLVSKEKEQQQEKDAAEGLLPSVSHFAYIITRPTNLLKDGPSTKKLAATKSQPGPFSITHIDLADFTLSALLSKKLYNSCPYIVADSV